MYVVRSTIEVKYGCLQELLSLQKETWEKQGARVYVPLNGNLSVLAVEWEFETMAAMEDVAASFVEMMKTFPRSADLEKHDELIVKNESQLWHKD